MDEKTKNGYMTMEAALVFPFVLGVVIFVLYLGFYLYNAAMLKQTANVAVLRGSRLTKGTIKDVEALVEQQVEQLADERLLLKKDINLKNNVTFHKVKVKIDFKMLGLTMEEIPFLKNFWNIETKAEAVRINPVDIIRGIRKLNENTIPQ